MNLRVPLQGINFTVLLLGSIGLLAQAAPPAQAPAPAQSAAPQQSAATTKTYPPELVQKGQALFRQDCSFCHGRDAGGGETGPDLTRSRLVRADIDGDKIGPVVRNGRPDKGMPPFDRSDDQMASLVAFIHTQQNNMRNNRGGGRKGVDPSDLQTGNAEAGKQYFEGKGGCSSCHSPTGDLAGIASKYKGLELEQMMLYPRRAKSKVTVTLATGENVSGTLAYVDEFTIALTDSTEQYRSWRTRDVQYKIDSPVNAHKELFPKYTDADVHNLMAYLQTFH